MGRKQEEYKGLVAEAISFQLKDKTGFTVCFGISSKGKSEIDETYAPGGVVYPTDEEALEAGLRLARQRIDAGSGD